MADAPDRDELDAFRRRYIVMGVPVSDDVILLLAKQKANLMPRGTVESESSQ